MDDSLPNGFLSETCLENSICLPESFEKPILGNQDSEFIIPNEKNHIELSLDQRMETCLEQESDFITEHTRIEITMIEEKQEEIPIERTNGQQILIKIDSIQTNEEFDEQCDSMGQHKDAKEETTQDSPRDSPKRLEITKFEEVLDNSKKAESSTNQPASEKAQRHLKRQREKKTSLYFEGEPGDEVLSEEETETNLKVEGQKKIHVKKQSSKGYIELVNTLNQLNKFEWLDGSHMSNKLVNSKQLTPSVIWFMICAYFFPRNLFANKNPKEAIHQKIDKLKAFIPDVIERITKNDIKTEIIQKNSQSEFEDSVLDQFKEAIKVFSNTYINNNDYLKKTMSARNINTVPKSGYTVEDDEWIIKTRRFLYDNYLMLQKQGHFSMEIESDDGKSQGLLSKIDLQDLITLYEKDLYDSIIENEKELEHLEQKIIQAIVEEEPVNRLKYDFGNPIVDLRLNFPEDEVFISLLEKKQNEGKDLTRLVSTEVTGQTGGKSACNNPVSKFKPRILIEDMVCYVCNDGDYTEDDLIVFCSAKRCNISVHQGCYGIPVIPIGDWICDVCLNFGENGKYLRCPLCDKRGGAMKPCQARADTDIFETLNPNFHAFLKSYATPEFIKENSKAKYLTVKDLKEPSKPQGLKDDNNQNSQDESDSGFSENLYYDIQFLDENFTEQELLNEPKPAYLWAHMTCILFIPELFFGDQTYLTAISGLENIPKDRFRFECEICGKKRNGSIVNCEKGSCKRAFHPECARRAKYFLDIRENENDQMVYHIFCEKHTPLKLRRTLENKEKKMKDEINKFFKMAEKYCAHMTMGQQQSNGGSLDPIATLESKLRKFEKKEDISYFMNLVQKYKEITALKPWAITVEKACSEESEDSYLFNIINVSIPKPNITKDRKLTAEDEIWGIMPYKNLTPEQKYKKYRKIMSKLKKKDKTKELKKEMKRRNLLRAKEIKSKRAEQSKGQNKETKLKATAKSSKKDYTQADKNTDETSDIIYCLCKQKYHGELMTACDGCGEWFHPACVGIPPGIKLEKIKWWCRKCCKKRGHKEYELFIEEKKDGKIEIYKKKTNKDDVEKDEVPVQKKLKVEDSNKDKIKKK